MDTILNILHVATAVFIIGPMAILPMTALRTIRTGAASQVTTLAKSTALFTYLSLAVAFFGFGVLGMADPQYDLSVTTPWVMASLILYVIAFALNLILVVPGLRKAAHTMSVNGGRGATYPAVAAGSGTVALLLLATVVLMVWKP
ncbi:conjugal transfer protein TrbL [Arthrobacter sp. Soil782]|uniref:DUF2269 family protein n=1 Tax=Arthrobacter sp. Soil782 TaxID=1736410 RepID=UPI0006FF554D|nr:DUF2269 family protein [Arthrobacter sp. Soil782]KRF08869.1 conjugal transfer protein TrbL [Arthrobacter sp. Soil782]